MSLGLYKGLVDAMPQGRISHKLRLAAGMVQPPAAWGVALRRGTLTHDMVRTTYRDWILELAPFRDKIKSALEIGSYEGQSAMFWLDFFPGLALTCVDPWAYYTTGANSAAEVEEHFDANVGNQVFKIKSNSIPALYTMTGKFDLIYIDGDHSRDQVLIDSLLAWPFLAPGGVMIWDDYASYDPQGRAARRPQPAIDAFIDLKATELCLLANTQDQLFVVKQ
jgi:predicted O-methyltransferase YrrM